MRHGVKTGIIGAILLGLTSYIPTFTQGVLGTGALAAGNMRRGRPPVRVRLTPPG